MVDRTELLSEIVDIEYYADAIYDVEMSTGDTTTLGDFVSSQNLKKAVLMKKGDGLELTCTVANNVVTCTGAATNAACRLYVFGVKA